MDATIDGRSLYYEIHGEGDPILLVHGFPLSGELWAPVVPSLRERFRLVVPDLRGHGRSEASPRVTMAGYADDLVGLLDAIGERRPVVLVAMSMGGYIAFELCRRQPSRLRALVLTHTRAQADTPEGRRARDEMAELARGEGSAAVAEQMLPRLFGPRASAELRSRWTRIMSAMSPEGIVAALGAMAGRPDSFPTLASVRCPVLIVAGEDDTLTPPDDARRMHEAAAGSRLAVIPGAGHMSPVERPDAFLEALTRFLADLPERDRR
jgi:pimeloyl-ACP methyl ester carboxylesterase